jgi:hypothetical protein
MRSGLFALVLATLLWSNASAQQATPYDDRHRISVTGEAEVDVAPDRIIITFGVDTRDPNLLVAKQQNDAITKKALPALKGAGVPDRDIQTDQLSISQRFGDRQEFLGYTVRNMFAVTLTDPTRVEAVISMALDAGVNHLLHVDFQTSDLKKYREQAREMAVKAAREKAEKMAGTLGQTVGAPIQIDEAQGYNGASYYSSWSGAGWDDVSRGGLVGSQMVTQMSAGQASDTVALGKVAIRASVRVVFELAK